MRVVRRRSEDAMNVDDFPFAQTEDARRFCARIAEAMVRFSGLPRPNAIRMIREFWADTEDLESDPLLYHEPPYYYAMSIAHHPVIGDNRPQWYKDPSLWPPPADWSRE